MLTYGRVQSVLCIMHHLIPYIVKWTVPFSKSVTVPYEGQHNSEYARKEGRHLNKPLSGRRNRFQTNGNGIRKGEVTADYCIRRIGEALFFLCISLRCKIYSSSAWQVDKYKTKNWVDVSYAGTVLKIGSVLINVTK
jgi:hypothetical protein